MSTSASISKDTIFDLERKRREALTKPDLEALAEVLAADLRFTHSNGKVDTKESLLTLVGTGQYVGWEQTDVDVRIYGEVAVVTGKTAVTVKKDGASRVVNTLFVNIWRSQGGRIENVLYQSSSNLQ